MRTLTFLILFTGVFLSCIFPDGENYARSADIPSNGTLHDNDGEEHVITGPTCIRFRENQGTGMGLDPRIPAGIVLVPAFTVSLLSFLATVFLRMSERRLRRRIQDRAGPC